MPEENAIVTAAYQQLREGCGLVDAGPIDRLRLRGKDRLRFLGGLVTCEVKDLEPGQGSYGFLTDIKGRLLADAVILAGPEDLSLLLPEGTGGAIEEHLLRYRIADRVEIDSPASTRWLSVVGPRALEAVGSALPKAAWAQGEAEFEGVQVTLFREGRWGLPAVTVLTDAESAERVLEGDRPVGEATAEGSVATDSIAAHGSALPRVDRAVLDIVRVEEGRPRFGIDIGADNFPQETGIETEAVNYSKGCYLGQEVVARIHYRGGVNRRLVGLRFTTAAAAGQELSLMTRSVGTVSSFVRSPRLGPIGLAVVHRRAEEGAELEVEGGGTARVVALPFEP